MRDKVVCVVDDDPGMLASIQRLLRLHGFRAEGFGSTEDFKERGDPDRAGCLILDVHLGNASGIEFGRENALAGNTTPVIFVTCNDSEPTRGMAFAAGCMAYFSKPFAPKAFLAAVEQAVTQSSARTSASG
jgi:FixJ family two-component response regulator